ncbi:MAG: hypothetical protein QM769_05000 [Pseudoxanthomonas sp.]
MLKKKERHALYVHVEFGAVPQGAPKDFPIKDVLSDLDDIAGTDDAVHFREEERKWTRLMDVQWLPNKKNAEFACLLFTVGDRDGALDALQHMETGVVRTPERDDLEGNARSAQLMIEVADKGPYRGILESVDMVGKTNINETLTALLRQHSEFTYKNEDGDEKDCRPTFKLDAVEDRDITGMVTDTKQLRYFVLIEEGLHEDYDEENKSEVIQRTARVRVDDKNLAGKALWDLAKMIYQKARGEGYNKFRIVYRRPNEKNATSVTYDTHAEDAEDFLIKRIKKIELKDSHDTARKEISVELRDKMLALLEKWIEDETE